MEDKGESKFRNVMERYWYALFIIAVALAAAVIGFICEAWKMQEGFLYDLLTSIISTTIAFFLGAELDIIQKYDSKEVIDVVNNCSERLLGSLLAKNM